MAESYDPDRYQTERPEEPQTTVVRPRRRAGPRSSEAKNDDYDPSISGPMRQILDHIKGGESGGRYNVIYGGQTFDPDKGHPRIAVPITSGPNAGRTSSAAGAFQFIGSTWDEVAAKTGRHDMSKESQDINAARLARDTYAKEHPGRDIEQDWASGDPSLRKEIDRALGTQWEALAAGPRVSNLDVHGKPRMGFGFSDYAMNEHKSRPDTDIHWMSPQDYLDMALPLEGKPFQSPSGKSLMQSFRRGDPIESVPSLDVNVEGNTAKVADQDGRHRALLAQQEGVQMIPVAVKRTGEGQPTEIEGMNGNKRPLEMPQRQPYREEPQPQKEPISLSRVASELLGIPKAEAAETGGVPEWMKGDQPVTQAKQPVPEWMKGDQPVGQGTQTAATQGADPRGVAPGGMAGALGVGVAKGLGETASGAEELLGKSLGLMPGAVGRAGDAIASHAQANNQTLQDETAETAKAHPWMTGIGDLLGASVAPAALGGRSPTLSGLIGGLMSPSGGGDSYWLGKAGQAGLGAGMGMAAGPVGNVLSKMIRGAGPEVSMLAKEGVQMTPGQIAGGRLKDQEDKLTSLPFFGDQIKEATRRSIQTFNNAAVNRSLEDIGVRLPADMPAGRQAVAFAEDQFRSAYDTVIPRMVLGIDNPLRASLLGVLRDANNLRLPDKYQQELLFAIKSKIVDPIQQATGQRLNGKSAQMIGSDLDGLIKQWKNSSGDGAPYYNAMAKLLRAADTALDDALERQNPILQAAKSKIDKGYAKFKVVQRAANNATGHPDGVFTPFQLLRAIKFQDGSKDDRLFARGGALLQDLASAAQKVLPSHYPDSGTAGRGALAALITGHLMGIGGLGAAFTAGAAYTPAASKALSAAVRRLSQQPGMVRNALGNIGQAISAASPVLAGGLAAGAGGRELQGQPSQPTFYQPPP